MVTQMVENHRDTFKSKQANKQIESKLIDLLKLN